MDQRLTVRKGQRYAEISRFSSLTRVWEVDSIYKNATGIPHARLVDVRDRSLPDSVAIRRLGCARLDLGHQCRCRCLARFSGVL